MIKTLDIPVPEKWERIQKIIATYDSYNMSEKHAFHGKLCKINKESPRKLILGRFRNAINNAKASIEKNRITKSVDYCIWVWGKI